VDGQVKTLAGLLVALAVAGPSVAQRDFTVAEAKRSFQAATGRGLVDYRAASTPDARALRTQPYRTARFGTFQLFVLNPRKLERMRRTFTHGVRRDGRGIHWVPDQAGGWIAVTVFRRNLLIAWFPPGGTKGVDAGWTRLDRAMRRIAQRAG
jgi:hypothetical protein